jgi:hypothetical protein
MTGGDASTRLTRKGQATRPRIVASASALMYARGVAGPRSWRLWTSWTEPSAAHAGPACGPGGGHACAPMFDLSWVPTHMLRRTPPHARRRRAQGRRAQGRRAHRGRAQGRRAQGRRAAGHRAAGRRAGGHRAGGHRAAVAAGRRLRSDLSWLFAPTSGSCRAYFQRQVGSGRPQPTTSGIRPPTTHDRCGRRQLAHRPHTLFGHHKPAARGARQPEWVCRSRRPGGPGRAAGRAGPL